MSCWRNDAPVRCSCRKSAAWRLLPAPCNAFARRPSPWTTRRPMMSAMRHHHDHQDTVGPRPAPTIYDRIYTCPMHPEVRQKGPGFCPKCGMALEPEAPTTDEGSSAELADMTRRECRPDVAAARARHGGDVRAGFGSVAPHAFAAMGSAPARDAGRAVGRLAILRARLAVHRQPQPEHVHADRAGHSGGVRLQRVRGHFS